MIKNYSNERLIRHTKC